MFKAKIKKQDLIALFLCFSFIPVYAIQLIIGSNGYLVLMLLSGTYVVFRAIADKQIMKSFLFWSWFLLMLWMMLCSFIGNQNVIYSVYYVGKVALWFLANDLYLNKGSIKLLQVSRKYVGIIIIITFIQQIIAPGLFGVVAGSGNMKTFFASDNFLGYYYTAYIALCFILDFVEFGEPKAKSYVMTGVCMASIMISWAVKNVIGIGLLILYIVFVYRKKISKFFGPRTLIIAFLVIFVGIVFMNVQQNFSNIIGMVFDKDSTFSVRYYLWTQAVQNIKASPIFGYGIAEGAHLQLQYNFSGNARSSHNLILELTIQGGIIGSLIYFASVIRCLIHNERKFKGNYSYEFLFLVFNVFLFFLIQMGSGSIYYPFYYMPLILIDNLDNIVKIQSGLHRGIKSNGKKTHLFSHKL